MSGTHLRAQLCASIPGHTASSPRETEPLRPSEAGGVAQRRRQEPRRLGRDRPQGRGRGVPGPTTSIHPQGTPILRLTRTPPPLTRALPC